MRYAQNTKIGTDKSKAEIEKLLVRYGADQFANAWKDGKAVIQFRANGRMIRFILPLPQKTEERFTKNNSGNDRPIEVAEKAWEQACRQIWRALVLIVRAKLEAVESEITTFEEEFYSHIVLPSGKTIYEETKKGVALAYETGKVANLLEFKD